MVIDNLLQPRTKLDKNGRKKSYSLLTTNLIYLPIERSRTVRRGPIKISRIPRDSVSFMTSSARAIEEFTQFVDSTGQVQCLYGKRRRRLRRCQNKSRLVAGRCHATCVIAHVKCAGSACFDALVFRYFLPGSPCWESDTVRFRARCQFIDKLSTIVAGKALLFCGFVEECGNYCLQK